MQGKPDRFIVWPLAASIVAPAGLVLLWSLPFEAAFIGALPLLLIWSIATALASIIAIYAVASRHWKRAASAGILPLVSVTGFVITDGWWSFAIDAGEHLHFYANRSAYLAHVNSLPVIPPRLAFFDWGGLVVGHGVVFDESDQILLPADRQSSEFKMRLAPTELECGVWGEPLGDHFYLVRTGC